MFTQVSFPAPAVSISWLLPAIERQNSPRAWPAPPLAPLHLPAALRQHLLLGLLAACKQHLQRRRASPADDASIAALLSQRDEQANGPLSTLALNRQSTVWLIWQQETELRLALRVLLAPASAFGVEQTWQAALARQTLLAARLARVARLYEALAWRLGSAKALARLERALAALADNDVFADTVPNDQVQPPPAGG